MSKLINKKQKFFYIRTVMVGLFFSTFAFIASAFTVAPAFTLPTSYAPGNAAVAVYTVTNNSSITLTDNVVRGLPAGVTQSVTDPVVTNLCGNPFTLASHASCNLKLLINAPVSNGVITVCQNIYCTSSPSTLNVFNRNANRNFLAVGANQSLVQSADAVNWKYTQNFSPINAVMYNSTANLYVAVGDYGTILTSGDGILWAPQVSGTTLSLRGVAWNGSNYVAVGGGGTQGGGVILTSPDALNWTTVYSSDLRSLYAVNWNGGQFMTIGMVLNQTPVLKTSPDGTAWVDQTASLPLAGSLFGLTWNVTASQYVVVGSPKINVGTTPTIIIGDETGQHWSAAPTIPASLNALNSVTNNGTQYVAVGDQGYSLISSNGTIWTETTTGTSNNLKNVNWNGTQYVAVGDNGTVLTSPAGTIAWTAQFITGMTNELRGITWNANASQYVAVGDKGTVLTSPTAVAATWVQRNPTQILNAVNWNGFRYVAVGQTNTTPASSVILTSPTGARGSWTSPTPTPAATGALHGVAYSGSLYVTVGTGVTTGSGVILSSLTGTGAWTQSAFVPDHVLWGIIWSGTQFVAVGDQGFILTSPDGITWTQRGSDVTSSALHSIAWSGTEYVAVGDGGVTLISANGLTWTTASSAGDTLNGITWNGSQFVAVGNGGLIVTSPDPGTTSWETQTTESQLTLNSVMWSGTQFVAVGNGGTLLTSPNGITWTVVLSNGFNLLNAVT